MLCDLELAGPVPACQQRCEVSMGVKCETFVFGTEDFIPIQKAGGGVEGGRRLLYWVKFIDCPSGARIQHMSSL